MDFRNILGEIIERAKPPLEKMHDAWKGDGCWPEELDLVRYRIYPCGDVEHMWRWTLSGNSFRCRFCDRDDRWVVSRANEKTMEIIVFSCPHEPLSAGRGMILKQDTIPGRLVCRMEVTYWPQWLE